VEDQPPDEELPDELPLEPPMFGQGWLLDPFEPLGGLPVGGVAGLPDDEPPGGAEVDAVVWAELEELDEPVVEAPEISVPTPSPRPRHPAVRPPATSIFFKRSCMAFLLSVRPVPGQLPVKPSEQEKLR
jgi:hypothetical protein